MGHGEGCPAGDKNDRGLSSLGEEGQKELECIFLGAEGTSQDPLPDPVPLNRHGRFALAPRLCLWGRDNSEVTPLCPTFPSRPHSFCVGCVPLRVSSLPTLRVVFPSLCEGRQWGCSRLCWPPAPLSLPSVAPSAPTALSPEQDSADGSPRNAAGLWEARVKPHDCHFLLPPAFAFPQSSSAPCSPSSYSGSPESLGPIAR